jgi:hypothetical protein
VVHSPARVVNGSHGLARASKSPLRDHGVSCRATGDVGRAVGADRATGTASSTRSAMARSRSSRRPSRRAPGAPRARSLPRDPGKRIIRASSWSRSTDRSGVAVCWNCDSRRELGGAGSASVRVPTRPDRSRAVLRLARAIGAFPFVRGERRTSRPESGCRGSNLCCRCHRRERPACGQGSCGGCRLIASESRRGARREAGARDRGS